MLEIYNLRKSLDDTRKELAHALYQYDAATRVISKLIKEKESSQAKLELAESNLVAAKIQIEQLQRQLNEASEIKVKRVSEESVKEDAVVS